jgi:DNA-binding SARP family transcriptional activator/Tfp pilus assembly protein PilF
MVDPAATSGRPFSLWDGSAYMSDRKARDKIVPLDFGGTRQPVVRIHVLGAMRATSYLGENILPRGKKARAVFGYLCLNAGQRVGRSRLASLLWDRVPDQQARTSLRQALREVSAAMGPLAHELITADVDTLKLDSRLCWIDALALLSSEAVPNVFRGDPASFVTGEILEDLSGTSAAFDQWLIAERSRFTSQLRLLFESELQQLSDADPEQRAALARSVIAFDGTHEGASRVLMRALADMGERAQALREYERCRAALRTALDVEPSAETRALYQALRTFCNRETQDSELSEATLPPLQALQVPAAAASRLRVHVMAFQGTHSPVSESLALSLSQDIAAALAKFRWFDVISPLAPSRGTAGDTSESLLRRKDLHYLVDGDILGNEAKFQINVRLLDVTQEARPVWSDRFDLTIDALDRVNHLITGPIAARIDPVISFIEGQQTGPQRAGATAYVLRAVSLMYGLERESYEEAGRLLSRAMQLDPENAKAAAWGAYWQVWHVGQGWAKNPTHALATAQEWALRAIRLDPENAEALGIYAHICAFLNKDFDSALHYFDRALRLNPNLAFLWALSAPTYCYVGKPDLALEHLDRYRELAPFDHYYRYWEGAYTIAYVFKGEYEKAATIGRRAVRANPEFSNGYKPLIAALGHLGRREEAAPYVEKLLSLEPNFSVTRFGKVYPIRIAEDRDRYMQGLLRAGVPEN